MDRSNKQQTTVITDEMIKKDKRQITANKDCGKLSLVWQADFEAIVRAWDVLYNTATRIKWGTTDEETCWERRTGKGKVYPTKEVKASTKTLNASGNFKQVRPVCTHIMLRATQQFNVPNNDGKMDASHLCHNKFCIRPSHIIVESRTDNQRRKNCAVYEISPCCNVKFSTCRHEPKCIRRSTITDEDEQQVKNRKRTVNKVDDDDDDEDEDEDEDDDDSLKDFHVKKKQK